MTNGFNEPVEELLLSRFIAAKLRGQESVVHLRVGQPKGYTFSNPAPLDVRQLYLSTLPEADLVVRNGPNAVIYEFGIWRPQTKLGQLLLYLELLRATPGYTDLVSDRIRGVLVQPMEDQQIERGAAKFGIGYEVFPDPEVLQKIAARRGGA